MPDRFGIVEARDADHDVGPPDLLYLPPDISVKQPARLHVCPL
jgi:hypothetical protein